MASLGQITRLEKQLITFIATVYRISVSDDLFQAFIRSWDRVNVTNSSVVGIDIITLTLHTVCILA